MLVYGRNDWIEWSNPIFKILVKCLMDIVKNDYVRISMRTKYYNTIKIYILKIKTSTA